jgi:hypothetical protein
VLRPLTAPHTARLATVSDDHPRKSRLARRWLAAVCVAVATAGGYTAWQIHVRAQPCWAVRQLIDFNRGAQDDLNAKTYMPPAGSYDEPRVPTEADYRAWTDGLQERADKVTAPGLAAHATRIPELARAFLEENKAANDQMRRQPISQQTHVPPAANDMVSTNREFVAQLRALNQACPGGTR